MIGWAAIGFKRYEDYLVSDLWLEKKDLVLKKFPICYDCNKAATQVHHTNYERVPQEKLIDLLTLCSDCHNKRHNGK
jgi:5-methylcytosine-specific restriction endonuclease McrA